MVVCKVLPPSKKEKTGIKAAHYFRTKNVTYSLLSHNYLDQKRIQDKLKEKNLQDNLNSVQ